MGSPRSPLSLVTTNTIMTMKAIEPIVDLLKDAYVQEKVEEAAKLFYSNDTVTINLYWAAAAALLFFLLLIPLLALFFQPSASSGGYGAPDTGYGAPEESYGDPAPSYGSPGHSYSRSDDIYGEARSLYNDILSTADVDGTLDNLKSFDAIKPLVTMAGNAAAKLLE